MSNHPEIHCYAVRRLNPFLGVVQIVETPVGRASTANGLVWHIELPAERTAGWGSLFADKVEKGWYLCGLWSEAEGLIDSPLAGQGMNQEASENSRQIIDALRTNQDRLPFELVDRRELWLLDSIEKKPLALLFAMRPGAPPPSPEPRFWRGSLGSEGLRGQRRFPGIDQLEAAVRKRAGSNPNRLWVTWNPDRTKVELPGGGELSGNQFPIYGIREDWPEKDAETLLRGYIDWAAPSLLTIPYLNNPSRARLESGLEGQACSIEYHWRLYPEILDEKKVKTARVQARLQQ